MLYGLILTIHVLMCFVLIAVILLQAGRGGGLSDAFGGGAAQSFLGTRGAAYLTRATTVCATIFMFTSLGLAILSVQRGRSLMSRVPATQASSLAETALKETQPETAGATAAPASSNTVPESANEQTPAENPVPQQEPAAAAQQ
ncbi:MAG: preprotein translocase subunit SecG [Candidatus Omnitrophica bacterium]|nr:preprotein translocase subunit SecG [Candidatus Omnitrophota bacterium]